MHPNRRFGIPMSGFELDALCWHGRHGAMRPGDRKRAKTHSTAACATSQSTWIWTIPPTTSPARPASRRPAPTGRNPPQVQADYAG